MSYFKSYQKKKCTHCKKVYFSNSKFFYNCNTAIDDLDYWGKNCKKEYDKKYNEIKRLEKYKMMSNNNRLYKITRDTKQSLKLVSKLT